MVQNSSVKKRALASALELSEASVCDCSGAIIERRVTRKPLTAPEHSDNDSVLPAVYQGRKYFGTDRVGDAPVPRPEPLG